ncbi:MAG: hypothetical protein E7557_03285 [Ruminococcaceae bacterium]|nr:hypothetical protein [Oscillospiraceae bacterium]
MKNINVSFYGYNDGKAIRIYNCINLFLPTVISTIASLTLSVLSYVLSNPYLLIIWIIPAILFFTYILCFAFTNYDDRVFLSGSKKKHSFIVENANLIRDGKLVKKDGIKVYPFKKFVFMITQNTYYRIPNEEFVGISREEFLDFIKCKN